MGSSGSLRDLKFRFVRKGVEEGVYPDICIQEWKELKVCPQTNKTGYPPLDSHVLHTPELGCGNPVMDMSKISKINSRIT